MLVVLAFNLFGDWLRDWLDPRLRQQVYDRAVVLEVRDLHVHLHTRWGVVRAVDGVSFARATRARRSGSSASRARGKTMTALSLLRLLPSRPRGSSSGEMLLDGDDLVVKSEREMRRSGAARSP